MAKKPTKDAGAAEGDGAAPKSRFSRKTLIIAGGGGLAVLVLLGGGAFMLLGGGEDPATEAAQAIQDVEPTAFYLDLPTMILNLAPADNRAAYVKLAVSLEVSDRKMLEIIEPNMPRIQDAFQTYMRELRTSDLQGSAGLYRLKEELQRRINIAVYPARVDDVLFKNVIVQ